MRRQGQRQGHVNEVMRFLATNHADHQFGVKAEMLRFVVALLLFPASPYLQMEAFCNAFMRCATAPLIVWSKADRGFGRKIRVSHVNGM